jgi:hypothetical protein
VAVFQKSQRRHAEPERAEFYRCLLSNANWTENNKTNEPGMKANVKHEEINEEVMEIVLKFLYVGSVDIPQNLIFATVFG